MPAIALTFLGPPQIVRDGQPVTVQRRKSLALLAYLAVTGQAHSRDALATLLWPDLDQARGHTVLRSVLADLHRALGADALSAAGDQVAWRGGPDVTTDVVRFRALTAQVAAHHPAASPLCDACLAALRDAATLYRADFLAGFSLTDAVEFDAWQTIQTETLRLELAGVLEKLAHGLADRGQFDEAIRAARQWLAQDPLNEAAHRALIAFHGRSGDRAAAARQFSECTRVLQTDLGIAPEPETVALYEAVRTGRVGGASAAPAAPLASLPADATPFIGREPELAQVAERLADPGCHLLTVLGPGGMGKTRLALQAARRALDQFRQGVYFVDLAPLTAAEQLSTAVLQALRAPRIANEPDHYLLDYLADKHLLLVLDNYEHLLSGEASDRRDGYGLVTQLVAAAPQVKLLVTSRARLNVRAEWLAPLEGMRTPGDWEREDAKEDEEHETRRTRSDALGSSRFVDFAPLRDFVFQSSPDLENYSATALFLACARRIRPDFRPTADDAQRITHICRLLGGMPLAIELAAAWVRVLPLAEIARRLETGLDLLATTQRDASPRHRSMRAAFDHSWRLLSARERSILRQLAVFRGGCTAEAAAAVAGANLLRPEVVAGLADKSWLRVGADGRYDLHELVRQYCAEKLAAEHELETGETPDQVGDRHATHFLARLKAQQQVVSTWQDRFQPLLPDWDNVTAVWRHSIAHNQFRNLRDLLALVSRMDTSAQVQLQMLEAPRQMLLAILKSREAGPETSEATLFLVRLLDRRSRCHMQIGKLALAAADVTAGLEYLDGLAQTPGLVEARFYLRLTQAVLLPDRGEFAAAIQLRHALLAELPAIHTQLWPYQPDRTLTYWRAEITAALFYPLHRLGQYAEAEQVTRQCLKWFATMPWACNANALANLGLLHHLRGEYGEALRLGIESLRANQAHGQQAFGLISLLTMAQAETALGRLADARTHYQQTLAVARAVGRPATFARGLAGLAELELTMGRPAAAKALYEEMLAHCEQNGLEWGELLALAWIGLGRAALALGDPVTAEASFGRALRCHGRYAVTTLDAIAGLAQAHEIGGDHPRAVELLALVTAHPAASLQVRQPMTRLLAELEATLPAEQFAAAAARGRARELDEVVAEWVEPQAKT
jgi:predicted ATPase/DNA-binding SARP family transcriptional activator